MVKTSPYTSSVHTEIPIGSERSFAIVFTVAFTLVGLYPVLDGGSVRRWAIVVAAVILFVGLVAPRVLSIPNRLWFYFGLALGAVVAQVIMLVIFVGVVTPTGLILRFSRRWLTRIADQRFPDPRAVTYWIPRGPDENPMGSMEHQF